MTAPHEILRAEEKHDCRCLASTETSLIFRCTLPISVIRTCFFYRIDAVCTVRHAMALRPPPLSGYESAA